jgi:DNA (cytosine-5)-methyltransferase 1
MHLCESVWDVDPIKVTRNRPVGLVWLSPDCKHFSKAKGGTPVEKHIRGLAWVALRWAAKCKPRVIILENVEEFRTWGPLILGADGKWYPDPSKKGRTFESFERQLRGHGYRVEWRELRASDLDTPTIRKRFFLVARRDDLPIVWPAPTTGDPETAAVLAGQLKPWRTAAECIDFSIEAQSIFDRARPLVVNTQRRVAKGAWRYVLTNPQPFIVGVGGRMGQSPARPMGRPMQTGTSKADACVAQPVLAPVIMTNTTGHDSAPPKKPLATVATGGHHAVVGSVLSPFLAGQGGPAYSGKPVPADRPLGAQTTENHRAVVAPLLAPLRGTEESHLQGDSVETPTSTISAGGTHHALAGAHLITIGYGERPGQDARAQEARRPLGTAVTANKHAVVEAYLVDAGHGEGQGGQRWSHGIRTATGPLNSITASNPPSYISACHLTHLTHQGERAGTTPRKPLPTVTGAHRGEQAMVAACLEQANGGFYDGDGRPLSEPISTLTASGAQQRLISAYFIKYYGEGGQWSGAGEPVHTLTTKARVGLVETIQVSADVLAPELRARARQCADFFHEHLPEHFPEPADMIILGGWVLVDITLRMLVPRELYLAQGFPATYQIDEIPDPKLLFINGHQVEGDPRLLPRIKLSKSAQVRMCGNSVCPPVARALIQANFSHEREYERRAA